MEPRCVFCKRKLSWDTKGCFCNDNCRRAYDMRQQILYELEVAKSMRWTPIGKREEPQA